MITAALDIGNSAVKGGLFAQDELGETFREPISREVRGVSRSVVQRLTEGGVERVGISSVVPAISEAIESGLEVAGVTDIYHVSAHSRLPFDLDYETPSTLGVDRIAAMAGVYTQADLTSGKGPVVVVDAGTAVTIDVLLDGRFIGGPILAGPDLLRGAVGSGTAQLPRVDLVWPSRAIARGTAEAVATGIMMGFVDAVRGMLLRVIDEIGSQPVVVVTGGWAELLADKVTLIGHRAPHLVLRGVAHLTELNR